MNGIIKAHLNSALHFIVAIRKQNFDLEGEWSAWLRGRAADVIKMPMGPISRQ